MEPGVKLDALKFGLKDDLLAIVTVYLSNGEYYESPRGEDDGIDDEPTYEHLDTFYFNADM